MPGEGLDSRRKRKRKLPLELYRESENAKYSKMSVSEELQPVGAQLAPQMDSSLLDKPPSPPLSYLSMESDMDYEENDRGQGSAPPRVRLERPGSPETRQSETSHQQTSHHPQDGTFLPVQEPPPAIGPEPGYQPYPFYFLNFSVPVAVEKDENLSPMGMPFVFKSIQKVLEDLTAEELTQFKQYMPYRFPEHFENLRMEDFDVLDVVDKMLERCGKGGAVKVAMRILSSIKRDDLEQLLGDTCKRIKLQHDLKVTLKRRHDSTFEGIPRPGRQVYVNSMYSDVLMTEGGNAGVNMEHEVREAELNARRQDRQEIPLTPRELFKPSFLSERGIRTVMTRGIAGIGSTILLQKFIVDWVEEKANQDIQYVFTFPFRELNLVKSEKQSLLDLICLFYTEMKEMDFIEARDCKVLFIFEDLDDYRYPLHFQSNERWHDVNAKTSVDMLLTNLIRGSLLPSALVWITARPAASEMIPADCINLLTQVRGFTDVQKERYFRNKFRDQTEATRLLAHLNSSRSLYIMCHIPLFSWIIATVFERRFAVTDREEKNTSVTQLFAHYVILQTSIKNSKYHGGNSSIPRWTDDDRDYLLKIGKLAYQQLEKGATEFNADDIKACGLDVVEATVRSGLITELFSGMNTMFQQRVFCFVHLSIQEFLAALYVFMYFRLNHRNILDSPVVPPITRLFKEPPLVELLKIAVDKALQSPNGHLDMFLRFLLGLAPDSSLELFRSFIPLTGGSAQSVGETARYIRKKIQENAYPDRCSNLNQCLVELGI